MTALVGAVVAVVVAEVRSLAAVAVVGMLVALAAPERVPERQALVLEPERELAPEAWV